MARRNNSIELLRNLLMLGICILHSCTLGGYVTGWVCRVLCPCVPCFVFISGYYGIKATPMRIAKLIGTAFACVPVIGIVSWFTGYEGMTGLRVAAAGVVDNWFVWSYVGLMCFAPVLNYALASEKRLSLVLPIIVMCLGWGFLKDLPWLRTFMPTTDGLGSYTFTMMVGTYLVAGLWRRYCSIEGLENWRIEGSWNWIRPAIERYCNHSIVLVMLLVISSALCGVGFSAYCSPVSVFWSAILFSIFLRIEVNGRLGAVAAFVAKSTFPIFIIHANGVGFGLIRKSETLLHVGCGMNVYVMYIVVGLAVFLSGLLLDMPRRLVVHLLFRAFFRKKNSEVGFVECS